MNRLVRALVPVLCCASALGQTPAGSDSQPSFRSRVDLVLVPVVVRDKSGNALGGLTKDDFQLFDRGKAQVISQFAIEDSAAAPSTADTAPSGIPSFAGVATSASPAIAPSRFVAYVFDDIHASQPDLNDSRDAADRHIAAALDPADRVAIFATSGQNMLDFTDDRKKIHDALFALRARSKQTYQDDCLPMSYSMADQIYNMHNTAMEDALLPQESICADIPMPPMGSIEQLRHLVEAEARRVLSSGDSETNVTLSLLSNVVRRLSTTPGERDLIVVSPGFLVTEAFHAGETDLMQLAVRANVIIGAVSARGLVNANADDSSMKLPGNMAGVWHDDQRASAIANEGTLAELAAGTGGQFFHNSNDLLAGLNRVASRPRFIYLLGFSPQQPDGKYHELRVSIRSAVIRSADLSIQARRGYYALKTTGNPVSQAGSAMRDALYSHSEQSEIPITVAPDFAKQPGGKVRVTLNTQLDIRNLRYRKAEGVNVNSVDILAGVFDPNGKLVDNLHRQLDLKLKDDVLAKMTASSVAAGVLFKAEFDLTPGKYVIRMIVRDSEEQKLTAHTVPLDVQR